MNRRQKAYESSALPLSYAAINLWGYACARAGIIPHRRFCPIKKASGRNSHSILPYPDPVTRSVVNFVDGKSLIARSSKKLTKQLIPIEVALFQQAIQKTPLQQWAQFWLNTGLTVEGHTLKAKITIDENPTIFREATSALLDLENWLK